MAHSHEHIHGAQEHEEVSRSLPVLAASALLFIIGICMPSDAVGTFLFLAAFLLSGWSVLSEAAEHIFHGEVLDEMFLMSLAGIGAICVGEYRDAAAVMLLYQLGEFLQDRAIDSSRRSIRALMDIRPDTARVAEGGTVRTVPASTVRIGQVIEVRSGESIPLDGTVIEGSSALNTAALTGESLPREVTVGSEVCSACVNLTGTLLLCVTKPFGEDSASRILALVEHAEEGKAKSEKFITRFGRVYTPIVVSAAAVLALVPPLMGLGTLAEFGRRALNFLVISCPCALVISIPLTFFSGIGCASHHGILIKGSNYLEALSRVTVAAFDKTGTLTEGKFRVSALSPAEGVSSEQLLALAAFGECKSSHPLARSIVEAYAKPIELARLHEVNERAGFGVSALLDGKPLLVGKASFLRESGIVIPNDTFSDDTCVFVAFEGRFCGVIHLRDRAKADAKTAIDALHALGIRETVMLTGDRAESAEAIGRELGIDRVLSGLLPAEKLGEVEKIRNSAPQAIVLYAGDGINDTPVLRAADVGIAMGGLGTDAAMEAADIVLMSDEPGKIVSAIRIARKTVRIAKENIAFSIFVKILVLALSAFGQVPLWAAVFADVGVCMLAILNSLRALR